MSNGRILIVERDAIIALDLAESLELAGYEVCCADRSSEGIRVARQFHPELAIVDADVGGPLDLVVLHETQHCGLIYLTSHFRWRSEVWSAPSLPLVILEKPFSSRELMNATAMAMRHAAGGTSPARHADGRRCSPPRDAGLASTPV